MEIQYMSMMFTLLWDVGTIFLHLTLLSTTHHLLPSLRSYIRPFRFTYLFLSLLITLLAHASQGANISRSLAWTYHLATTTHITLIPIPLIRTCLRMLFLLFSLPPLIAICTFLFSLTRLKSLSSPLRAQSLALLPLSLLTTINLYFTFPRLWASHPPSALLFALTALVPDALATSLLALLATLITRWDRLRRTEVAATRTHLHSFWSNHMLDALSYARALAAKGRSRRAQPWIVGQAVTRFGISPLGRGSVEKERVDLVETLLLLKQLAEVVSAHVELEADMQAPLWGEMASRRIDLRETERAVVRVLGERFRPMTEAAAERLARDWTAVFSMGREEVMGEERRRRRSRHVKEEEV